MMDNVRNSCSNSAKRVNIMNIEMGAKIRQLRQSRGLTQEELGNELGVSAQAVSKWEGSTTLPDIQLLPEMAVLFGVSIDELFSVTDESRMDRIENMISHVRFLTENEFHDTERFLKAKIMEDQNKPRATLMLASLYVKRSDEYRELAKPLAREALLLNPNRKMAHNMIFDSEGVPCWDWNEDNHWELIAFYKEFVDQHPQNVAAIRWLLDLLADAGRAKEVRIYAQRMDKLDHSFRTDFYLGRAAQIEGDLETAFRHWNHMVEEYPDHWCAWSVLGDALAYTCRYEEASACYQKSMEIQEKPRYMDNPVAMAQIAEIQGDYEKAIQMRTVCIELCRTDWHLTEGEWVDHHLREIERLQQKLSQ